MATTIEVGIIHFGFAANTHMQIPITTLAEMMNPIVWRTKLYTKIAQKVMPIFCKFLPLGHVAVCGEGQMNSPMDNMIMRIIFFIYRVKICIQ